MLSTVLAFLTAAAAKVSDPFKIAALEKENAIVAELQAQVDDLNRKYDEQLATVTRQRDEALTLAMNWRERSHVLEGRIYAEGQNPEADRRRLSLVQQLNQAQQNRDPFPLINFEGFCNCVPSRDQVFRAERIREACERPFGSSPAARTD